ncbi:MAG: hypothetical protein NTAFB05_15210 [Nitrobacter sp.]|uniref:hypothetical protein n=1 Tax=Nitrobacter sp. TaxID=29420 RepID=UPI00387DDB73
MSVQPISIVVRLSDVTIARSELERTLGLVLDRYEKIPGRSTSYAQIDIPEADDYWSAALNHIRSIAPVLVPLVSNESIGSMCLDVAIPFHESAMAISSTFPSPLAEVAGSLGMDIEVSIYRNGLIYSH